MGLGTAIIILCEVLVFIFLVYGFSHEEKFIAFEDRIIDKIKKKFGFR